MQQNKFKMYNYNKRHKQKILITVMLEQKINIQKNSFFEKIKYRLEWNCNVQIKNISIRLCKSDGGSHLKMHEGQNCTRAQNCTKTLLHEGSKLHEGSLLHEGQFCTKGQFCTGFDPSQGRVKNARGTELHEQTILHDGSCIKK